MMLEDSGDRRTLAEWAMMVAMSERSLRRQIERETGFTFGRWRPQFQLAIALRDLRSGVPVKVVAEKLGDESMSVFATMFKKYMGRPPANIRVRPRRMKAMHNQRIHRPETDLPRHCSL
jgi:AraC-like DNA-binding protein